MHIARVVIVRVIVDGVLGVTIDVLIGLDEIRVIYVAIFVLIFGNWRCTLYTHTHPSVIAEIVENRVVGLITSGRVGDVVGVVTPLVRGGAQVLHGDQVVKRKKKWKRTVKVKSR